MFDSNVLVLKSGRRARLFRQPDQTISSHPKRTVLTILLLAVLAVIALLIHFLVPLGWNVAATQAIQSVKAPGLQELMRFISGFGNAPKVVAITVIALVACNKRKEAFFIALSGLGGWFIAMQLKHLFASPRPTADLVNVFHEWPTGSFPSGHLVFYVCYFGFFYLVAREKLPVKSIFRSAVLVLLALLIALVGISRVYLGEHWLSDLPGSYFLGAAWLFLSLKLYRFWILARTRQQQMAASISGYR